MGKVLFAVCAFLATCIVALALVSYFGRDEETLAVDNLLAEDLTRRIQTAESETDGEVDLVTATDFAWDRVLIVAPKTPRETLERELDGEFNGVLNYDVESGELFVFERAGRVVRFADYRGRGRFEGFERPVATLTDEEAVLRVDNLTIRPG